MKQKLHIYFDHIDWLGNTYNRELEGMDSKTYKSIIEYLIDNYDYESFDEIKEGIRDDYSWIYYPDVYNANDKALKRMTVPEFNEYLMDAMDRITEENIRTIGLDLIKLLFIN